MTENLHQHLLTVCVCVCVCISNYPCVVLFNSQFIVFFTLKQILCLCSFKRSQRVFLFCFVFSGLLVSLMSHYCKTLKVQHSPTLIQRDMGDNRELWVTSPFFNLLLYMNNDSEFLTNNCKETAKFLHLFNLCVKSCPHRLNILSLCCLCNK